MQQDQKKVNITKPDQKKSPWQKAKAFELRTFSQIKPIQFHGTRHRG